MRFISATAVLILLSTKIVNGFAPSSNHPYHRHVSFSTSLDSTANDNNNVIEPFALANKIQNDVKGVVTSTFMAAALWAAPIALLGPNVDTINTHNGGGVMNDIRSSVVADAKEMASGSGSRVNKDAESLLRYGLPIPKDKEVSVYGDHVIMQCSA